MTQTKSRSKRKITVRIRTPQGGFQEYSLEGENADYAYDQEMGMIILTNGKQSVAVQRNDVLSIQIA